MSFKLAKGHYIILDNTVRRYFSIDRYLKRKKKEEEEEEEEDDEDDDYDDYDDDDNPDDKEKEVDFIS
ncbi:hypothetical protein M0802_013689 [Mischocyttarus mexicanus]|nr:hypothetical protein M0802_013695 [Mischocyttarus mexicanus]KAI4482463.1 hypothetical protein M0802_013689 [Mischocyttarus mexicanus]